MELRWAEWLWKETRENENQPGMGPSYSSSSSVIWCHDVGWSVSPGWLNGLPDWCTLLPSHAVECFNKFWLLLKKHQRGSMKMDTAGGGRRSTVGNLLLGRPASLLGMPGLVPGTLLTIQLHTTHTLGSSRRELNFLGLCYPWESSGLSSRLWPDPALAVRDIGRSDLVNRRHSFCLFISFYLSYTFLKALKSKYICIYNYFKMCKQHRLKKSWRIVIVSNKVFHGGWSLGGCVEC